MDPNDRAELEKMGDIEKIKETLIHRGQFWVWMSPDRSVTLLTHARSNSVISHRFPLETNAHSERPPVHFEGPKRLGSLTNLEMLPSEILASIASNMPLVSDVLHLGATSRHTRYKLLGTSSNRNAIARAWIHYNAPWYIPTDKTRTFLSWAYLRQCLQSGSMKNRERIWRVVQRMEIKAMEMGLQSPNASCSNRWCSL